MKKLILPAVLITVCAVIVVIVSCEKDNMLIKDGAVRFTSEGTTATQTRVAIDPQDKSVWEKADPVGIYMVKHGTSDVLDNAENMKYTASEAGLSTSFAPAGQAIYYPLDETGKVDFIAYHPYRATVSDFVYPVDVSNQASQTNIDLMWAAADKQGAGYSKEDGRNNTSVDLAFDHQLAKLRMNVTKDSNVPGEIVKVSINGMNTTASFDLKGSGGFTGMGNAKSFEACTVTAGSVYEAILLPVGPLDATHTVTFTTDQGDNYTWSMYKQIAELNPGKIYTYDITVAKYVIQVTGNINSWTVGATGIGNAE